MPASGQTRVGRHADNTLRRIILIARHLEGPTPLAGNAVSFSDKVKGALKHLFGAQFDRCFEPLEAAGLRAVCHHEWPTDPALIAAWEQLSIEVPSATTFHSPIWQKAVFDRLGKKGRLRLIVVWEGGRLRS